MPKFPACFGKKGMHAGRLINTAVLLLPPHFQSNMTVIFLLFMVQIYVIAFSPQASNNYSQKFYTKMLSHTTVEGKNRPHD